MEKRIIYTIFLVVLSMGCTSSSPDTDAGQSINELTATASEFEFALSTNTVKAGSVKITVKNVGTIAHEFILLREKDAAKLSPIVAQIKDDDLPEGTEKTIQVTLTPGVYEISCHLPGHYEAGMKATLTIVD